MTQYQLSGTELQVGARGNVFHCSLKQLTTIRFEWHPSDKRVYYIRVGVSPEIGVPLADGIEALDQARAAVLYWGRGYLEGKAHRLG